jgi:hypothetical protein
VLPRRKVEEKIVEMGSLNKRGYLLVWNLDAVLLLLAGPGHGGRSAPASIYISFFKKEK